MWLGSGSEKYKKKCCIQKSSCCFIFQLGDFIHSLCYWYCVLCAHRVCVAWVFSYTLNIVHVMDQPATRVETLMHCSPTMAVSVTIFFFCCCCLTALCGVAPQSQCVQASCRRCHRILAIVISFHWNAFPPPVLSLPLSHPSPYFDSTLHFTHNEWWRARGCCAPYDDWLSRLGSLPHWYVAVATANQSTDTHSLDISFPSKVSCYGNRKPNSGSQNTEREKKKKDRTCIVARLEHFISAFII